MSRPSQLYYNILIVDHVMYKHVPSLLLSLAFGTLVLDCELTVNSIHYSYRCVLLFSFMDLLGLDFTNLVHFLLIHDCLSLPSPPNRGLSLQNLHIPQSVC